MLSTFVFNLHTVYERYLVQSWLFLLIFHILTIKRTIILINIIEESEAIEYDDDDDEDEFDDDDDD